MLMASAAFVSCSDINLSDLNSEVEVQVRDLTLPVKLDKIKLSTMLDIEDDSKIQVRNGEYAIVVDGEFESDAICVEPIVIKASNIDGTKDTMGKSRPGSSSAAKQKHRAGLDANIVAVYALSQLKKAVAANADKVHEAIQKLTQIEVETHFTYSVTLGNPDLFKVVGQVHLQNLSVLAPRGVIGHMTLTTTDGKSYDADYDSKTGVISFAKHDIVTSDGVLNLAGDVQGFDANLLEDALKDTAASKSRAARAEKSSKDFSIDEEVGINAGELVVYDIDFKEQDQSIDEMYDSLADDLDFTAEAEMQDIVINSVSGSFAYDVDDVALEDVSLNDIPSILHESGTNIVLDNPQIYLYLENSVIDGADNPVGATASMSITSADDKGRSHTYDMDNQIEIDQVENYLYLAPHAVDDSKKYDGFEDAKHVAFSELGKVLSNLDKNMGDGFPTKLNITTHDTHVAADNVQDLALGKEYGLSGHYYFLAPLALTENSRLKYTESFDGWAEDTKDLVISKFGLDASVTTDVPCELVLRVIPVNSRGERYGNIAAEMLIPANAKGAPINVVITGDIRDLDGVKIDVTAVSKEARVLTPDMNISLSDLKVKVSGNYDAEL